MHKEKYNKYILILEKLNLLFPFNFRDTKLNRCGQKTILYNKLTCSKRNVGSLELSKPKTSTVPSSRPTRMSFTPSPTMS